MNRYDSYKDSGVEWIEEIPSHWVKSKLKYNNQISLSNIDKKEYEHLKSYPIIHYNDVIKYGDIDKSIDLGMGYCSESQYLSFKVSLGDIIITKDSMDIKNICDSTIITEELEGVVYGYHLMKLSNERSEIHPRFTYYFFNNVKTKEYFLNNSNGTTIIGVSKNTVENTIQLLLPLSEQQQIVSFLDTKTTLIDSLIEKTKQRIKLLEEKRISLINEVVTQGLNPNVEKKESGVEWIGKIPSHWDLTKIKYEIEVFGRIGYRGYTTEDIVDEGEGVITISPSNIKNDVFNLDNRTYLSWEKYHESPEIQIFRDDIILVKTGSTIGKTSIIPDGVPEMTINPQLVVLKKIKLFPKFLYYQTTCKFIKESFDIEETGSTTPTISQEKINNFPLVKPSLSEQQQIVEYLDEQTKKIDEIIFTEEKRIQLLTEYKQSLISEVVTGKKRVVS